MTREQIEARQAGREAAATVQDLWRGVPTGAVLAARNQASTIGEEFAATRELRRRRREARLTWVSRGRT